MKTYRKPMKTYRKPLSLARTAMDPHNPQKMMRVLDRRNNSMRHVSRTGQRHVPPHWSQGPRGPKDPGDQTTRRGRNRPQERALTELKGPCAWLTTGRHAASDQHIEVDPEAPT